MSIITYILTRHKMRILQYLDRNLFEAHCGDLRDNSGVGFRDQGVELLSHHTADDVAIISLVCHA